MATPVQYSLSSLEKDDVLTDVFLGKACITKSFPVNGIEQPGYTVTPQCLPYRLFPDPSLTD